MFTLAQQSGCCFPFCNWKEHILQSGLQVLQRPCSMKGSVETFSLSNKPYPFLPLPSFHAASRSKDCRSEILRSHLIFISSLLFFIFPSETKIVPHTAWHVRESLGELSFRPGRLHVAIRQLDLVVKRKKTARFCRLAHCNRADASSILSLLVEVPSA